MRSIRFARLCAILALCAASIALAGEGKGKSGKGHGRAYQESHKQRNREGRFWRDKHSYFHEHGYTQLDIPPGHYPPPGECRIWFPGRPPGQQPPIGNCHPVPHGAWLIRHPADRPDCVHVTVYEPSAPDRILVVGEFNIGSGVFVRVVLRD